MQSKRSKVKAAKKTIMDDVHVTSSPANQGKRRNILRIIFASVELPLLFYVFGLMLHMPLLQQYSYLRFSEEDGFKYDYSAQHSSCGDKELNATEMSLQKKVQEQTAHFQIGQSLCNTIPSFVVCLFLGSWSDNFGRKPVILLCVTGAFLESVVVLITMFLKLPLAVVYIGSFLNGLGGYFTGLTLAVMAYIADTTEKDKRALRLGIMEALIFLGAMLSQFSSGHLIKNYGFKWPYILVVCSLGICCFFVSVTMPESLQKKRKIPGSAVRGCLSHPLKVWYVLSEPGPRRWKIATLIPATLLVNMLSIGISSVLTLYLLNSPFCMPSIEVGYFIGTRFLIMGFGAAIGIKLFSMVMQHHYIALIGILSYVAFYTLMGISKDKATAYLACVAGAVCGMAGPVFRGILSKSVTSEEQGALFSAVSSLEMLSVFLGNFLFNALYPVFNNLGYAGAVFLVVDVLLLIPTLFNVIYAVKIRKEKNLHEDLKDILGGVMTNPSKSTNTNDYGSNGLSVTQENA